MSRYDLFRRRLAPIALFLGIALIARESCNKNQRIHTTIQLDFGADAASVRAVDVDVIVGDDTAATFHRIALPDRPIGTCELKLALEQDEGELRIVVERAYAPGVDRGGDGPQRLTRHFHAVEGSTMLVPIPPPR